VSVTELTGVGALLVSVIVAIVLPVLFKKQTANQLKAQEEALAKRLVAQQEIADIKERAKQDAAKAASDVVSWDGINRALRATGQEASAAHQEQIVRLREEFAAETARLKRHTDYDLDRAHERIRELAGQVEKLEQRLAGSGPSGGR
jgi:muconolactone delta-isomerase